MEWIRVEDNLPEFLTLVLGINQWNEQKICYRTKHLEENTEYWMVEFEGWFLPTHWMPLPNPPKE